ncbi:MAG: type II secretion system protein [Planctomycetes bacterium]|nr:type II secretion system protein [Planctomycetota bacterium]
MSRTCALSNGRSTELVAGREGLGRNGFTLLELTVVIGVALALSSLGVTALTSSLRDAAVDSAAQSIERAADFARGLAINPNARVITEAARRRDDWRYGVVLVDTTPGAAAYIAVTYGPTATEACILRRIDGAPVFSRTCNRNVAFYAGPAGTTPQRLGGGIGWLYQWDTGFTASSSAATLGLVCVGVDAARLAAVELDPATVRIADQLAIGTIDGRIRLGIEVLPTGLAATGPWGVD